MTTTPEHGTIKLKAKSTANLHYTYVPRQPDSETLVVFLNGLILPQSSWAATISQISLKTDSIGIPQPHLLSYDRYGQGLSDRDPSGDHDITDVVNDLHDFLQEFSQKELGCDIFSDGTDLQVILVANSIGCAIARLFAATYPVVSGFIFLDSMMAHIDLVSLWPDPDNPMFDSGTLPEDTTVDQLRQVREKYRKIFDISAPNPEGLDRSGLSSLLPFSNSPKLKGRVTVVGHDPNTFAKENERSFGVPTLLVDQYINPDWQEYNKGLAELTDGDRSRGPIIAKGCGHFIQKDDPAFVADEVCRMLQGHLFG